MRIELKQICVPTDFSDHSEHALTYAITLTEKFNAQLHLIHVIQDIVPTVPEPGLAILPTEDILRSLEKGAKEGFETLIKEHSLEPFRPIKKILHGVPFQEIGRYSKRESIDLIIIGTHGRSGLAHFLLGSVAERVVRSSPCPVLTIRHPEHEFIVPDESTR